MSTKWRILFPLLMRPALGARRLTLTRDVDERLRVAFLMKRRGRLRLRADRSPSTQPAATGVNSNCHPKRSVPATPIRRPCLSQDSGFCGCTTPGRTFRLGPPFTVGCSGCDGRKRGAFSLGERLCRSPRIRRAVRPSAKSPPAVSDGGSSGELSHHSLTKLKYPPPPRWIIPCSLEPEPPRAARSA